MSITALDTSNTSYTEAATSSSLLDADAFLQLLITEIEYQDPLDPLDSTEYITQLAQLSEVEQLTLISDGMTDITDTIEDMGTTSALNYLGTSVEAEGSDISLVDGQASTLSVTLADDASEITINILNEKGNIVETALLAASDAGTYEFVWDGLDYQGNTMADGTYTAIVSAENESGASVDASTSVQGTVTGVEDSSSGVRLTLDDGRQVYLTDVSMVTSS